MLLVFFMYFKDLPLYPFDSFKLESNQDLKRPLFIMYIFSMILWHSHDGAFNSKLL